MWEPQLRTPGIATRAPQASWEIRVSSGSDVPGFVSQCIRKSRSLKSGSSDWPRWGTANAPATASTPTAAKAGPGRRISGARLIAYARFRCRTSGASPLASRPRRSSSRAIAGVTVRATAIDASTASAYESDEGLEERAGEAFEEEHGHHGDDVDQRRVEDRPADLHRRFQDAHGEGSRGSFLVRLPDPTPDVLDVDDRVVHHDADRDHEAGQQHHVDRFAAGGQDQHRGDQGERDRHAD